MFFSQKWKFLRSPCSSVSSDQTWWAHTLVKLPQKPRRISRGQKVEVDEAYRLNQQTSSSSTDYGKEVLEIIMKRMEEADPLIILARYPAEMDKLLSMNTSLERRVRHHFTFVDNTPAELAIIFAREADEEGYTVAVQDSNLTAMIVSNFNQEMKAKINAAHSHRLFENSKRAMDEKICSISDSGIHLNSACDLFTNTAENINEAAKELQ